MSWRNDLYSALSGDATLAAIVSSRIYPDVADSSASVPYVVYQNISTTGETTHDGIRTLEFPSVQLTAWAKTKAETLSIVSRINALLDGKTVSGTSQATFRFSNQLGNYDSETRMFGEIIEFTVSAKL